MATRKKIEAEVEEATEVDPQELQFPSDVGADEVEVAKRSSDLDNDDETTIHKKVFVIAPGAELSDEDHLDNIGAMRNQLINQGLRPVEDGEFVGVETNKDGVSQDFTYQVKVVPAHVANPLTYVRVEDQHAAEEN